MLMAPPLSRSGSMQRGGPDDVTLRLGLTEGSHINVVVTAIAREMLAFMWSIAREVSIEA